MIIKCSKKAYYLRQEEWLYVNGTRKEIKLKNNQKVDAKPLQLPKEKAPIVAGSVLGMSWPLVKPIIDTRDQLTQMEYRPSTPSADQTVARRCHAQSTVCPGNAENGFTGGAYEAKPVRRESVPQGFVPNGREKPQTLTEDELPPLV